MPVEKVSTIVQMMAYTWAIWISLIFQACSIWDHWDIKTAESCKTLQKYISLCFEYAYPPKKSAKPS